MDFESQVIEQLNTIEGKLDAVTEWKAATQPVCERHTEQIKTIKGKLFGNGSRGMERRLDTVEETTKTIRKIWLALITACVIAMGGLALQVVQHVSPGTHTTAEP